MISCEEALEAVLAAVKRTATETVPVRHAVGRVLAEPIISNESLPPFDNSAMDGFALRSGGGLPLGLELDVAGLRVAGDAASASPEGDAWEIMTGAQMPEGFDSVVPIECVSILRRNAEGRPSRIRLEAHVTPGQHRRGRGEDVDAGQCVLSEGVCVSPQQVMLLAAIGEPTVRVASRPRVAVISTGHELEQDSTQPLSEGHIRDSNGPYLSARVAAAGAELVHCEVVEDIPSRFVAAVKRASAAGADVILSTGAVSMGVHDFVPSSLRELGADIRFHKVAMRPGKPLLFAVLENGTLYFGLPGNPVAAAVGFRFFVEAALRAMLGMPREQPLMLPLETAYEKRVPMRFHLKGRVVARRDGSLAAQIMPGQESFRILPMAQSNAWIVLPAEQDRYCAGDRVQIYSLGHLDGVHPQVENNPLRTQQSVSAESGVEA